MATKRMTLSGSELRLMASFVESHGDDYDYTIVATETGIGTQYTLEVTPQPGMPVVASKDVTEYFRW